MKIKGPLLVWLVLAFLWKPVAAISGEPEHALPYGFIQSTSKEIPEWLTSAVKKAQENVGRLEIRAKKDIGDFKKGSTLAVASGYVLDPGNVIAGAAHLVSIWNEHVKETELVFILEGEESIVLEKLLSLDEKTDLALVSLPEKRPHYLTRVNQDPSVGMAVMVGGYPLRTEKLRITFGLVAQTSDKDFIVTNPSLTGMSGAPTLLLNQNGEVLGVLGTLVGTKGVQAAEGIPGAFYADYSALEKINSGLFNALSLHLWPENNLTEAEIQKKLGLDNPVYQMAISNYRLLRSEDRIHKTGAWIAALEQEADENTVHKSIHDGLKQMTLLSYPLLNLQARTLETGKTDLQKRSKADLERLKFLTSPATLKRFFDDAKRKPELLQTDAYLNQYFHIPARINRNP